MKEEIDYHKLADYFKAKMSSSHKDIEKDTASAVLSNWAGYFYYRHSSPAITLNELQAFNPIGLEENFSVLRCLIKNGFVKKIMIKNKKNNFNYIYYTFTLKFYETKNEYINIYEQNWIEFNRWNQYFNLYKENESFFDEIESFLKLNISYKNKFYERAIQIKNEYIGKIASELDFERRIQLKNKAILKIDKLNH